MIKDLDRPIIYHDNMEDMDITTSAREVLLKCPWPIHADPETCTDHMLMEVDFVTTDKLSGCIGALVRKDRQHKVEDFMEVYPPYVHQKIHPELARKMFEKHALKNADNSVEFLEDEDLNWNGKWETEKSNRYKQLANNNMGFDFSGMDKTCPPQGK